MTTEPKRIRGRKLQEIRRAHFERNPLCVHCQAAGRVTLATQLDHVVALVNGGQDVASNRQSLCNDCHQRKTAADLGQTYRPEIGLDGYPLPADASSRYTRRR